MYICSSCRLNGAAECEGETVEAGYVTNGLSVCGYETAKSRLPRLDPADQRYSSGFCPNCALDRGTMFPELVSEY